MSTTPELSASVTGGTVFADRNSAVIYAHRSACDYGHCTDEVTAVVMVTSGNGIVEVRTSCEAHINRMHEGWANKQVAIVSVGRSS